MTSGSTCTAAGLGAVALFAAGLSGLAPMRVSAATITPPMLDITRQCGASSRRNMRAMSECVVAESEARAEVLQKWNKLSDASAEKCIREGSKVKKFPYATLAKCVAVEPVDMQAASKPPIVTKTESGGSVTDWFLKTTGIRK